jgi:outer membrane immunogenic protein
MIQTRREFRDGKHRKDNGMQKRKFASRLLLAGLISLAPVVAAAQEVRSEVAIQGSGIFTQEANGRGIRETATDTGGVLGSYRYHINRWLSAEAVYGWNRNSQEFTSAAGSGRVQADVHQAAAGAVISVPIPRRFIVTPYILAEGGALVFRPTSASGNIVGANQQAVGTLVYGGGFDYPIPSLRKVALRVEYRGFLYKTPDFGLGALNADSISHSAQPSAGLVYHF